MIEVKLRGVAELHFDDKELYETVKETLSLDNPAYESASRFSKYPVTRIPEKLYYYNEVSDSCLSVPRGFLSTLELNAIPYEVSSDERIECTVTYPDFTLSLRTTQEEAFKEFIKDTDKGLIVLPTGKGKTVLGLYIAYRLKQRVLVVVHKDDLVRAWTQDYHKIFGENAPKVGLIKAQKKIMGELMTITTIQTLSKLSPDELLKYQQEFGMLIVDEVHRAGASSYHILNNFPACYRLGFTATLERNDHLDYAFTLLFGDVSYRFLNVAKDPDILPVKVLIRNMEVAYTPKDRYGIPYNLIPPEKRPIASKMLIEGEVLTMPEVVNQVCTDIKHSYDKGESSVAFFTQKSHIDLYYDRLRAIGVEKVQKYYGDSEDSKDVILNRAESKEMLVTLATYSIATEGTNVKSWEVAFLVSSVNNGLQVEQAVGRVRRTAENKRTYAKVYDYAYPHVYAIHKHLRNRIIRYNKLGFSVKRLNY